MRWLVFLVVLTSGGAAWGDVIVAPDGETVIANRGFYGAGHVHGTLILNGATVEHGVAVYSGGTMINYGSTRSVYVYDGGVLRSFGPLEKVNADGPDAYVAMYGTASVPGTAWVNDGATIDIFVDDDTVFYKAIEEEPYWEVIELVLPAAYTESTLIEYGTPETTTCCRDLNLNFGPGGGTVNIRPYVVPEPSGATLFLLGLLGLRRR
jgi:hypothetical protein